MIRLFGFKYIEDFGKEYQFTLLQRKKWCFCQVSLGFNDIGSNAFIQISLGNNSLLNVLASAGRFSFDIEICSRVWL